MVNFEIGEESLKLQRLELVHTGVYGLTHVPSLGRAMYFASFIEACKVWVFLEVEVRIFLSVQEIKCHCWE